MRILALLTTVSCLLLANCSPSTSEAPPIAKPAEDSATTTNSKQYTILSVERNPSLSKINIEVRLLRKLDEAELRRVALQIKAAHRGYAKTWIVYYLPGMKIGAGAWATTHFTPELKIQVLGASQAQEEASKKQAASITGKIVGRWYEEQYTHSSLVIYQRGSAYRLRTVFDNGQSSEERLLRKGDTFTYYEQGSSNGEYFKLLPDGKLGLFNREGKIFTQANPVR